MSRSYDNNFWVTGRSVNGNKIGFAYDDGLLTAAGDLSLTRDPDHGLVTATDLAGIAGSRTYNAFGELAQRSVQASGAGLYEAAYTRDKLGRIQSETETVGGAPENWDYTYDEAGRLTRVTRDGALVADYTYDANGNRTAVTTPAGTVTADYDAQDRLTRYGDTTYTYNQAGDLTGKTTSTGTTSYDYDALGNLRHVALPSGKTIDYVIDGKNRRVGKKVNGDLVQGFLYKDQLNPVAELDGSGNVEARFIYGTKPNVPATMIKDGTKYRIVSDHLGSVRLVINTATGAIAQRMAYGPFGQVTRDTNPGFQPFGFAGGIYDRDTGLVRFGARDYDPEVGRWTAKDPILFRGGQANLYGYVVNDPVNYLDTNGKVQWGKLGISSVNLVVSTGESVLGIGVMLASTATGPASPVVFLSGTGLAAHGIYNMGNAGIGIKNAILETDKPGIGERVGEALCGRPGKDAGAILDMYGGIQGGIRGIGKMTTNSPGRAVEGGIEYADSLGTVGSDR